MSRKPTRIRITDELNRLVTLDDGLRQYSELSSGKNCLVLGLGPKPSNLSKILSEQKVSYLECHNFESQMDHNWKQSIPSDWDRLSPDSLTTTIVRNSRVLIYSPNLSLFPKFWGPIWARCLLADQLQSHSTDQAHPQAWLLAHPEDLLVRELTDTLSTAGFQTVVMAPENLENKLPDLLKRSLPRLVLSLNFMGLDAHGKSYHLLKQAGAEIAVWCFDNPLHLLTRLKSNYWHDLPICLTDRYYLDILGNLGAKKLKHLPLAAWSKLAQTANKSNFQDLKDRLVFVGHSAFPNKESYFSGLHLPQDIFSQAIDCLEQGTRPDFGWWLSAFPDTQLWPGSDIRLIGYGAEESSKRWRISSLKAAAEHTPLTIYGDQSWLGLIPGLTDFRPKIDYYGPLSSIYASAGACLNVTSLLLPAGLTQRHFDVWACGGFLISDNTPGLNLFPDYLTKAITFHDPSKVNQIWGWLQKDSTGRAELAQAWQELILKEHTYEIRVNDLLTWLKLT